jgi:hypothetical protein
MKPDVHRLGPALHLDRFAEQMLGILHRFRIREVMTGPDVDAY